LCRYREEEGLDEIPARGPLAALTVAGTVSGWGLAKQMSEQWGGTMPLDRLLEDAVGYARDGVAVTEGQARLTTEKLPEMGLAAGFTRGLHAWRGRARMW
jgi:gamma-glutamyltranspeptidase/glutathione hydrolase